MFKSQVLKNRTKQFAIRIVKLFRLLPRTEEARIVGKQMLGRAPRLRQTIEPFVEPDQKLSS